MEALVCKDCPGAHRHAFTGHYHPQLNPLLIKRGLAIAHKILEKNNQNLKPEESLAFHT